MMFVWSKTVRVVKFSHVQGCSFLGPLDRESRLFGALPTGMSGLPVSPACKSGIIPKESPEGAPLSHFSSPGTPSQSAFSFPPLVFSSVCFIYVRRTPEKREGPL